MNSANQADFLKPRSYDFTVTCRTPKHKIKNKFQRHGLEQSADHSFRQFDTYCLSIVNTFDIVSFPLSIYM